MSLPVTRLSPDLLPAEGAPLTAAVERAVRLARTDYREQSYSLNAVGVGDQAVQDLAHLLSTYRRRLDGVGRVSVEPWPGAETGVHLTVHQAVERCS